MVSSLVLLPLLAAAAARWADATSSGVDGLIICNALTEELGCPADDFTSRNHLRCNSKSAPGGFSRQMHWTTVAKRDDRWMITATRPDGTVVTSYRPGEVLDIRVQMLNYIEGKTYRGIMLHFQQSSNRNPTGLFADYNRTNEFWAPNVGQWLVPAAVPRVFHSDLNPICGPSVLLHATASYKNPTEVFKYQTPATGTGTITLRAIVKQGDANEGAFYFPMEGPGDLQLTEATAFSARPTLNGITYYRGNVGQSCDTVCSNNGGLRCVAGALTDLDTTGKMLSLDENLLINCDRPLLTSCGSVGATSSAFDQCYIYDSALCAGRDQTAPTCAAVSSSNLNGRRLCPCNADGVGGSTGGGTPCGGSTCGPNEVCSNGACLCKDECPYDSSGACTCEEVSPAARASSSLGLLLLAAGALLSDKRSAVVLALVVAAIATVQPAAGHNWIGSMSRARFASTQPPFPPRESSMPHVQIGGSDTFQIEYVQGHTRESYFLMVHADDEDKVKDVTSSDLDDYLDQAVANGAPDAGTTANGATTRRYHRRCGNVVAGEELTNDVRSSSGSSWTDNYFAAEITSGAGYFGGRPLAFSEFGASCRRQRDRATDTDQGGSSALSQQLDYQPAERVNDKRAKYTNPTWPWMLEVARTTHTVNQPSRPDVLQFDLLDAAGQPRAAGHYILTWRWRGYYDATDIDYQGAGQSVAFNDRYGAETSDPPFRRVDHSFWNIRKGTYRRSSTGNPTTPNPRGINRVRQDSSWGECLQMTTDASMCTARCTGSCGGVVIAPAVLPAAVRSSYRTQYTNAAGYNSLIPWGNATDWCDPAEFPAQASSLPPNTYICLRADYDSGNGTQGDFITVSSPEDPIFYHSLILRIPQRNFTLLPTSPFLSTDSNDLVWKYGGECVDCDEIKRKSPYNAVPKWTAKSEQCVNCELEPSTAAPVDYSYDTLATEVIGEQIVSGRNYGRLNCSSFGPGNTPWSTCTKQITLANYPRMAWSDCLAAAQQDSDCGNYVMLDPAGSLNGNLYLANQADNAGYGPCVCIRSSCPGQCNHDGGTSGTDRYRMFEFTASPAAPNCTGGVKSSATTGGAESGASDYCCANTCRDNTGAPACYGSNAYPNSNTRPAGVSGLCAQLDYVPNSRTCDLFGPPCRIP